MAATTISRISQAVGLLPAEGQHGGNRREDVKLVQTLLSGKGYKLKADGVCGPKTIAAIKKFQAGFMKKPDGLIGVGQNTWKKLVSKTAVTGVRPAVSPSATAVTPAVPKAAFGFTGIRWPLAENHIRRGATNNTFGMVRIWGNDAKAPHYQGEPKAHQGWDLYAAVGTDCYAIGDGEVVSVATQDLLGKMVIIKIDGDVCKIDGKDVYATYAHLSSTSVANGDKVIKGQVIGKTGKTGNASNLSGDNIHLHFELRQKIVALTGLQNRWNPTVVYGNPPLHTTVSDPVE